MGLRRRVTVAVLAALVLGICGVGATWLYDMRQRLKAKSTVSWMHSLHAVCQAGTASTLQEVLRDCGHQGVSCVPEDAWGHPFVVEVVIEGPERLCRVVSTGRDGVRGSCCKKSVGWRWDEDAVLEAEWLQSWNYFESGKREG